MLDELESCADPEGGTGGSGPPLKNHKNIGFLSNTGSDPLENHKATKPAFIVGPSSARHRNAILKIVNEYDQEIPQSQTADNPVAPRGRAAQPSQDTRKTN